MKNYFKLAIVSAFAVLAFHQNASAMLLLEPYLGYSTGKAEQSSSSNYTGTNYGARIGYSMMGFAVGVEYAGAKLTDDGTPKSDLTISDLGVFASFKFPIMIRVYGTYFPSPQVKSSSSTGDLTMKSGNVIKLGVGYAVMPFININLEYLAGTYSDAEFGNSTVSLNPNMTTKGYGLVVSVPFDLL